MRMPTKWIAALAVFGTAMLSACADTSSGASSENMPPEDVGDTANDSSPDEAGAGNGPIEIGIVGIMTGENAQNGEFVRHGAELAVDAINEAGGVTPAGAAEARQIELVVEDDQATPDIGLNAITKLVHEHEVFAFLGPDFSGITFPSLQVAADAGVPQITSSIAEKVTQQGHETIFRGRSNDATWMRALIDHLVQSTGAQDIALAYTNIELGQSGVEVAKEYLLEEYELEPVVEVAHNAGDRDLAPSAAQILRAEPDAVIDWGTQIEASLLIRELRNDGYEGAFGYNAADDIFIDLAKEHATGVIGPQNWVYTVDDPATQQFAADYEEQFGSPPSPHSVVYFDGINLLAQAIEQVGLDQQKVLDYLHGLESYEGVQGTFRPAELDGGEMITSTVIIEVDDKGVPQVVESFE